MAVAPSPFVPSRGHTNITFFGEAVPGATITIFDKSGDLIQTLEETSGENTFVWNVKSRTSADLASGVYIWRLETTTGDSHKGKFAIIR